MSDPYRIEGPALISFSGGRTSAFMLHQIVQAHGGALPDDVRVAFANTGKDPWRTMMPMAKAKHARVDVMEFWSMQDFDLGLKGYEGNCDMCFLKARAKLQNIIRERPGCADWWIEQERLVKDTKKSRTDPRFVTEYTYAQLADEVSRQGFLPFTDDGEHDAECGLHCAA